MRPQRAHGRQRWRAGNFLCPPGFATDLVFYFNLVEPRSVTRGKGESLRGTRRWVRREARGSESRATSWNGQL